MRPRATAAQCPHLGFAADPFNHAPRVSDEHRCYAALGRERIDMGHQRRFCLAAAHTQCPFLMVSEHAQQGAWLERARVGWQSVSLSRPTLTAAQLGQLAGLGAAAGHGAAGLGGVVLQAWRSVRPTPRLAPPAPVAVTPVEVETVPVAVIPVETAPVEMTPMEALTMDATPTEVVPVEVAPVEATPDWDPLGEEPMEDLVELGIAAVEAGLERDAYLCFKRATEVDRTYVAAWFWRAKTAESLEEVINCLEHANRLEPDNELIAGNLVWAMERLESNHAADKARKAAAKAASKEKEPAGPARPKRPSVLARVSTAAGDVLRVVAVSISFALAAVWLVSGLPPQLRDNVLQASGLPGALLPDAARLTSIVHLPLFGGYDAATALPFAIGFFAMFLGAGLLNRERWTPLWVPTLALFSAWLIAG